MTKALSTAVTIMHIEFTLSFLAAKVEPGRLDPKIAEARRLWTLFRSHPYAVTTSSWGRITQTVYLTGAKDVWDRTWRGKLRCANSALADSL